MSGLFKGLGPNLMGVFPSRAIYFWAYSTAKMKVNASLPKANRDTPFVHVTSAASAGNKPLDFVFTEYQLNFSYL